MFYLSAQPSFSKLAIATKWYQGLNVRSLINSDLMFTLHRDPDSQSRDSHTKWERVWSLYICDWLWEKDTCLCWKLVLQKSFCLLSNWQALAIPAIVPGESLIIVKYCTDYLSLSTLLCCHGKVLKDKSTQSQSHIEFAIGQGICVADNWP